MNSQLRVGTIWPNSFESNYLVSSPSEEKPEGFWIGGEYVRYDDPYFENIITFYQSQLQLTPGGSTNTDEHPLPVGGHTVEITTDGDGSTIVEHDESGQIVEPEDPADIPWYQR